MMKYPKVLCCVPVCIRLYITDIDNVKLYITDIDNVCFKW